MCEVDNQGRCAKHAFVQLKRLSRSGDWKSLLEVCPLCAMDGNGESTALVPAESSSDDERRMSKVKFVQETDGLEVRKDYQFRPPSQPNHRCIDGSDHSVGSGHTSSSVRSALKAPKYKACPKKMSEQSKLEVTTMSMDMDIDDDSDSEDEAPQQQDQQQLVPSKPKRTPPPPPRSSNRQSRHKEEKTKRITGKSPARAVRRSTNSTHVNGHIPEQQRPDPEEFQHAGMCSDFHDRRFSNDSNSGPYITTRDVSDDVSAISFMGSVMESQPNYAVSALVPFQENEMMEPVQETPDFDFDNDNEDEDMCISTNNYDSKGRCVRHPHVRLRKKKILGRGWKVLMSACPDCCVDELRRIKLESTKRKSEVQKQVAAAPKPSPVKIVPKNLTATKESDDTASLSDSQASAEQPVIHKKDQDGIFVKNMMWTDVKGRRGSYTGQVDEQFIPNGQGKMHYEDGKVKEGEWKQGGCRSASGRSGRTTASERSSRSRSVSERPGARSRSTSVTPHTRSRSSSRAR